VVLAYFLSSTKIKLTPNAQLWMTDIVGVPPGVNFTNILQAAFSYKSLLSSFFVLMAEVCIFSVKENFRKSC